MLAPTRVLFLVGLLALSGCRNGNDGAVKLTVAYSGFKPGCLRVGVKDARGAGEERTTELAGKGEATGGTVTVAAFRESGWSTTLTVSASAFEKECQGTPVTTVTDTVTVNPGTVVPKSLALTATDADHDGYVSGSSGGTDCDDSNAAIHPGGTEVCNGKDDDCDSVKDNGFELGATCDAAEGCKGAWVCDTTGARTCEARPDQWHFDGDHDGYGAKGGITFTSCTSPGANYVPNDLDCDDSNPRRNPGVAELCNSVDDNCDGTVDDGLNVGADCTGEGACMGTRVCVSDGGVACNSPTPTVLFPDNDRDNHGAMDAGVTNCGPTRAGYVALGDDCDDTRANVYPGATERCDSLDNNCNGTVDDGFGVGTACDPGLGCTGVKACAADGGTQCNFVTSPSTYYPDDDLDQYGKTDAGVLTCAPDAGYILRAGDCNDGNPFTHLDAGELCDQEDNDCNGSTDEGGACPSGGGSWVSQVTGSDTWRSVTLHGDGGVWVAGASNVLRYRAPGSTSFQSYDGQCTGDWYGAWADPSTGNVSLGGTNTATSYHFVGATNCYNLTYATDTDVKGMYGVPLSGGGFEQYAVGFSRGTSGLGHALRWTGSSFETNPTDVAPLWDVHGLSRDVLFAVGGYNTTATTGPGPRVYRFKPDTNDWTSELVQNISGVVDDQLRGIWVVNPKLAYAVGESNSVLVWNGTQWSKHTSPGGNEDLLSVVAFGRNAVYATTGSGKVFRYNGSSWSQMPATGTGSALNDIAATSPGDIWVVGNNGKILHWPQ